MQSFVIALGAVAAGAQAPTWYGFRPSATRNAVDLIDLDDGAVVRRVVGTVPIAGEYAWPDAVRCLQGFCLLATSTSATSPAASSFFYNVSTASGTVTHKTPVPGVCAHMHVDFASGTAYSLCIEDAATGYRAVVMGVTAAAARAVVDITAQVARGRVLPGQTTHCSATHSMYVGVDNGGAGKDVVIAVDVNAGRVTGTTTLQAPLSRTVWATCDGSGVVGGLSFAPGPSPGANGTATFGVFDATGAYKVDSSVSVPPGHEPSGLLTATSPASFRDAFIGAFYPPGTLTNATATTGYLWNVDPYGGGSDDYVVGFGYVLIGAAWDRE